MLSSPIFSVTAEVPASGLRFGNMLKERGRHRTKK